MEKTIAIITTADTKLAELQFVDQFIRGQGFTTLTIDISSRGFLKGAANLGPDQVVGAAGYSLEELHGAKSKAEAISIIRSGITALIASLYAEGKIQAVFGFGGLQNTSLCASAMQVLPIGVPKVLLSTVASGERTFASFVGSKDITMIPSIADLAGVNLLTEVALKNASGAIMGMTRYAGDVLKPSGLVIGASMMGATNDGIARAVALLENAGKQVVTFHSTGVGGTALEELIENGTINAVLDLSLHEIVSQDVIGGGFSFGAKNRLSAAAKRQLPMVLAPGGLDFIDFSVKEFNQGVLGDPQNRKFTLHNESIAHIKLTPQEAAKAAEVVVGRLQDYQGEAVMILPLRGLRSETHPGEKLYAPGVDQKIFEVFRARLNRRIRLIELDAHLMDEAFSQVAANEMLRLIGEKQHNFTQTNL